MSKELFALSLAALFEVVTISDPIAGIPVVALLGGVLVLLGGAVVAGVYVAVQLWRYERPVRALGRQTVLGTVILGALLAASPVVALWIFGSYGF